MKKDEIDLERLTLREIITKAPVYKLVLIIGAVVIGSFTLGYTVHSWKLDKQTSDLYEENRLLKEEVKRLRIQYDSLRSSLLFRLNSGEEAIEEIDKLFFKNKFDQHKNDVNVLTEISLLAFEYSQNGTKTSYYLLVDLCQKIINGNTDHSYLIRFLKGVAKHWDTYEKNSEFIRPDDPGFFRHFVTGMAFYNVSKNLDIDNPLRKSAKEWSLVFLARFLGNINKENWQQNAYSDNIRTAANTARNIMIELSDELLKSNPNYCRLIKTSVLQNDFDKIFEIYKNGVSGYEKLEKVLLKPSLHEDNFWISNAG